MISSKALVSPAKYRSISSTSRSGLRAAIGIEASNVRSMCNVLSGIRVSTVAAVYDRRQLSSFEIVGGHLLRLRAVALALRGPPLQPDKPEIGHFLCKADPLLSLLGWTSLAPPGLKNCILGTMAVFESTKWSVLGRLKLHLGRYRGRIAAGFSCVLDRKSVV